MGDESYIRDAFLRQLRAQLPEPVLEFGWIEEDLAETPLEAVLDGARNPSLMAPLQVYILRNARELFSRASASGDDAAAPAGKKKHGDFPANLQAFAAAPGSPSAVLVFLADHLHLPADRARMALEDKSRFQRIEATLGLAGPLIPCAQPSLTQAAALAHQMASDAGCLLAPPLAQRLAELCDANLAWMQREIEKLCLFTGSGPIAPDTLAALVAGAGAASAWDLAQQIARANRGAALLALDAWWHEEGATGAVGLVFQLARIFSMALVLRQERVRDRGALYRVLPEGLRPPGFAADAVLSVAQRMSEPALLRSLPVLHRTDVALRSSPPSLLLELQRVVFDLCPA